MKKQPYIQFFTGDWLKDPKLSLCSPATRGIWIDLICALHELGQGGQVTASRDQIARLCRCTRADVDAALTELRITSAADIHERDNVVTIVCRRLKRQFERQQIYRENASKGGSKTASNREAIPEYEDEDEGIRKISDFTRSLELPDSDARSCFHKWVGNGWTNGGKPIRDWKATIRSWKEAGYLPSQKAKATNGAKPVEWM